MKFPLPKYRSRFLYCQYGFSVLATASLFIGCDPPERVVSTHEDQLTVSKEQGGEQAVYNVAAEADISRDGEPVKLEELDRGDEVQVIATQRDGQPVAIEITAESNTVKP